MSAIKETYPVEGMSCAGCATSVEKLLQKQQGVEQAKVSFEDKKVELVYNGEQTSAKKLNESLNEIGFELLV